MTLARQRDVIQIARIYQPRLGGRGHVQAASPKSVGDRVVYIFIKMKPDHCLDPRQPVSVRADRARLLS